MFNTPETMISEEIQATAMLVQSEIMTPEQAASELGFEYDKAYWDKQRKDAAKLASSNGEEKEKESTEDSERQET